MKILLLILAILLTGCSQHINIQACTEVIGYEEAKRVVEQGIMEVEAAGWVCHPYDVRSDYVGCGGDPGIVSSCSLPEEK